jgi:cytochrome c biogenesis protein CcmG/thiol:disulfide interchange protein DsbE
MGGKTAIALGLMLGLVVGGLIVGGVIALVPAVPSVSPSATSAPAGPSATPATGAPSPSLVPAVPSATPSTTPSATPAPVGPSAAPSPGASPSPSTEAPSASSPAEAFGIGEPAPPLVLPMMGGGTVDLADYRGKPVWVNFMATWCPSCVDELPSMAGFQARYEDTGLVVLAVDAREDEAAVAAFFEDVGVELPVGLDSDGKASAEWGAIALPVHYWIDAEGIVRDGALGGIGPDIMAEGLGTILPGVTVTP